MLKKNIVSLLKQQDEPQGLMEVDEVSHNVTLTEDAVDVPSTEAEVTVGPAGDAVGVSNEEELFVVIQNRTNDEDSLADTSSREATASTAAHGSGASSKRRRGRPNKKHSHHNNGHGSFSNSNNNNGNDSHEERRGRHSTGEEVSYWFIWIFLYA